MGMSVYLLALTSKISGDGLEFSHGLFGLGAVAGEAVTQVILDQGPLGTDDCALHGM